MNDSLVEILARLNWARSEIQALQKEIEIWSDDNIETHLVPSTLQGFRTIIIETREIVPIGIRARSGVIANEIRSCLDSLASALAQRNGKEKAYFPVADKESAFTSDKRLRYRLKKFREEDKNALLACRPFAIGLDGEPGNLLLYGLHHTDVKRKHHRLAGKAGKSAMTIVEGFIGEIRWIGGKARIPGRTAVAEISNDSDVRLRFELILQYAEPDVLRGLPLIETLNEFVDVSEAVVRTFLQVTPPQT